MFQAICQKIKNKETKNAGWLIGEQIFQMIISVVVGILAARYLGPSNFGSLNYTASFVSFFFCITSLGMEGVVIKKLIEHPDEEGLYLGSCLVFRFVASLLSILAITIIIIALNPDDSLKLILALLQSLQLIFKSVYIFDSWFQRHLKSRYVSIGKMIACLLVSAYKILLLVSAQSVVWFALSNALSDFVIAIVLLFYYYKERGQRIKVSLARGNDVLRDSYHFIVSGLMVAIYGQMDKIMIGKMMTDTDVGYYTTAATISAMWIFIPNAIIQSFRPGIMECKHKGLEREYQKKLQQLYFGIIWFCLGMSLVITVLSKYIVGILFGNAYLGAVYPLQIIVWCETFAVIGTARGIWILSENKNKYVKYYLAIGAVVNLILNFILIPKMGIIGAAIATLITQVTTSLIAPLFFKETKVHTLIVLKAFFFGWKKL